VQQQFDGAHLRVLIEPLLHDAVIEQIQQAHHAHALVVSHPFAHCFRLVPATPEIDGFIESIRTGPSLIRHAPQVVNRGRRIDAQREKG